VWYMHSRLCQVMQLLKMKMSRIVSLIEMQIILRLELLGSPRQILMP